MRTIQRSNNRWLDNGVLVYKHNKILQTLQAKEYAIFSNLDGVVRYHVEWTKPNLFIYK